MREEKVKGGREKVTSQSMLIKLHTFLFFERTEHKEKNKEKECGKTGISQRYYLQRCKEMWNTCVIEESDQRKKVNELV